MTCPICKQLNARRSKRQTAMDYIMSMAGVYPWRCRDCHARFYARQMPLNEVLRAHCPKCGNLDLQKISPEYVDAPFAVIWRVLRIPSYRCEPCRHKYFSILPPSRHAEDSYTAFPAD